MHLMIANYYDMYSKVFKLKVDPIQSRAIVKMVGDCVRSRSRSRKKQLQHAATESAAARAAAEKVLEWYEQVQQEARQPQQPEQKKHQEQLRYQSRCTDAATMGAAMQRELEEQRTQRRITSTHAPRSIELSKTSQPPKQWACVIQKVLKDAKLNSGHLSQPRNRTFE